MQTYLKKNRGLFFLPLAAIPFLILIFYILGGGRGEGQEKEHLTETVQGVNYSLPEAEKSIKIYDKMEAYQQHGSHPEELVQTPWETDSTVSEELNPSDSANMELSVFSQQNPHLPEQLLAHIKQKEREVKKGLEEPEQEKEKKLMTKKGYPVAISKSEHSSSTPDNHLLKLSSGIEELDKLFDENTVLSRQNDSLRFFLEQNQKELAVIRQAKKVSFSLDKKPNAGFGETKTGALFIKAEIYETTTVLNGNRVKLRLLEDTWINEERVPQYSFIYGICKIKNERLHIQITQLPVGRLFLPVNLAIHDLDGMPGLYVPDNVARKVMQKVGSSTNTSSMFGVSNKPLTYAGIRAADRTAQTLLKRTRLKKVTIRKNTLIYIINQNQ